MDNIIKILLSALLAGAIMTPVYGEYEVSNGYFMLKGSEGSFNELRFEPTGQGNYSENLIISLSMGESPEGTPGMEPVRMNDTLTLKNLPIKIPFSVNRMNQNNPLALTDGGTLGVKFTVKSANITSAGGKFPTWHKDDAGFTLTLYRLPDGNLENKQLIISRDLTNVVDNSVQTLEFDPQPPGVFYLEMSNVTAPQIGWWSSIMDISPNIVAVIDGVEDPSRDLAIQYSGYEELICDWTIELDGPNLKSELTTVNEDDKLPDGILTKMVTEWVKSGYDVSFFPFSRLYTDTGRHWFMEQNKRRPISHILQSHHWVYAMGKHGYDLRFNLGAGQHLRFHFEEDSAEWRFRTSSLSIDVLPHLPDLPDDYPIFYTSNPEFDSILNDFYYGHALNFGVGTPAEWKEWQALILSWTASPQRYETRGHFTGMRQLPDGYVYTWGSTVGWPFPYKDEDGDGKNDFDTRHFATNASYILGAYRYFAWTREDDFLKEVMPKLRAAMEYQLSDLQGRHGIIITNAEGRTGKNNSTGSNYWDILPFGHKDAFCNNYYYASLHAMKELESYVERQSLDLPGVKYSPIYYDYLRTKVRRVYNETFWDEEVGRYVGCVDIDGNRHDYGFTFLNLDAMKYGLADKRQAERIYHWMENEPTSSGKADTYSRWISAPRATTIHNPKKSAPQEPKPSWWHMLWHGTEFGEQCQDGGAILYTSFYDIMSRVRFFDAENAFERFSKILDRYAMPDRLMGGSPLYLGEMTQGGPGGNPGWVGVEGEFPESGMVPSAFLYAFLGINADIEGLKIRPNLPSALKFGGIRNLSFAETKFDIRVRNDSVEIISLDPENSLHIKRKLEKGETFILTAEDVAKAAKTE